MALPTLTQYYDACKLHDWHYEMSDSNDTWERGNKQHEKLVRQYKEGGSDYIKIYTAWKNHRFHGEREPVRPK